MNVVTVAVIVFLLLGTYTIYLDASQHDESFIKGMWRWTKQLGTNIKSITGFVVYDHTWLPNSTEVSHGNTTN